MFLFLNFIQYSSQIVFYFTQSARKAVAKYKLLFKQHIGYNDKFEPRKQDVHDAQLSSDEDGLWMTYRLQEGEITIVKLNEDLTVKVRFKLSCAVFVNAFAPLRDAKNNRCFHAWVYWKWFVFCRFQTSNHNNR